MNVSIIEWCMCALVVLFALMIFAAIRHAKKEKKEAPWGRFPASKRPFPSDDKLGNFSVQRIKMLPDVDVAFLAEYCDMLFGFGQEEVQQTYRAACDVLEDRRLERKAFWEMDVLPSGLPFLKGKDLLRNFEGFLKKTSKEDRKLLRAYAKSKIYEGDKRFARFYLRLAKTR